MQILEEPLEVDEMRAQMKKNGKISGVVQVDLKHLIEQELFMMDEFDDFLTELLTDTTLLKNMDYNVVGHNGNILFIDVSGDASDVIADLEPVSDGD